MTVEEVTLYKNTPLQAIQAEILQKNTYSKKIAFENLSQRLLNVV